MFNMNSNHYLYQQAKDIVSNWCLDDWSISKELFDKVVEILPFGAKILELGGGKSTEILSKFYRLITVEEDSTYLLDNLDNVSYVYSDNIIYKSINFPNDKSWYDVSILSEKLKGLTYDLVIVDGPKGYRGGFYDNIDIFNLEETKYIIFDDTMCDDHYRLARMTAEKLNRKFDTYQCEPNVKAVTWVNGKKFTVVYN